MQHCTPHSLIIRILRNMCIGMLLIGKVLHKIAGKFVTAVNMNTVAFCTCGFPYDVTNKACISPESQPYALVTYLSIALEFYRPGSNEERETYVFHTLMLALLPRESLTVFRTIPENRRRVYRESRVQPHLQLIFSGYDPLQMSTKRNSGRGKESNWKHGKFFL